MNQEQLHDFRKQIDACIKESEQALLSEAGRTNYGREMSLVRTKLQEAKMWAGQCLGQMPNNEFPEELRDEAK